MKSTLNNALLNDLERRYQLIIDARTTPFISDATLVAIHDYVDVCQKATGQSKKFHEFWHEQQNAWDIVWRSKQRVEEKRDIYFWGAYEALLNIHDDIESRKLGRENLASYNWQTDDIYPHLKRVHLDVVAKIEEDMNIDNSEDNKKVNPKLGIYYNSTTGKGWSKGKIFTFKDHQPEFILFEKLYKNIGTTIKRNEVLNITGTPPDDKVATYYINDLVKKMRMRTQLNTRELVQNNGNITLVGQKLDDFPNQP